MPSTYSPSLRIELIGAGEQSGTWGTTTNTNLGTLLEQSIAGVQAITMVDANYTLTNYNGVSDEARKAVLVASGTNTAARDIIAPLVAKNYIIKNNTTGGFAINIRAATGASVSIPNGGTSAVYCDGTNFVLALTQTLIAAGTGLSAATVGATTTISFGPLTSAQLATALTDETGTGANVFATSPTLVTPALGTPTALVGTNITGTASGLSIGGNAATATTATTASILNGTWNQMPAGTVTNFFQAAAPTGWTQNTSYANHMMRVVSGTGGGSGGTASPILNNTVPSHTHGFTTGGQSANHVHYDSGHTHSFVWKSNTGGTTAGGDPNSVANVTVSTGTGYASLGGFSADHTHSGSTDNGSSQTNWTPQYIDNIICSKN